MKSDKNKKHKTKNALSKQSNRVQIYKLWSNATSNFCEETKTPHLDTAHKNF